MAIDLPALEDLPLTRGQRVFARIDFNVPLDGERVTDDLRISTALPTMARVSTATRTARAALDRCDDRNAGIM